MKKLTALLLALVMVLAMNVTVFAEGEGVGTYGDTSSAFTNAAGITSVPVTVEIDTVGNIPDTTFTYSIANGAAVNADGSQTGVMKIYAGVTGGVTIANTDGKVPFSKNSEKTAYLNLTVVPGAFTHAGVYRYALTQTALSTEQISVGFDSEAVATGGAVTKYVDVYVENADSGFKVTNVVLFDPLKEDLKIEGEKVNYADSTKTDRFKNTFGTDPDTTDTTEEYDNYTVTITKKVTGGSGDKTYEFPFTIGLSYTENETDDSATTLTGMKVGVEAVGNATLPTGVTTMTIGDSALNGFKLADGQSIKLTHVPKDVLVAVKEGVDAAEQYTITYTAANFASGDATNAAISAVSGTDTYVDAGTVVVNKKTDAKAATITYTNNRDAISPTGVVLRIAPYAIMLGAGVVLFIILKSRKNKAVEEA